MGTTTRSVCVCVCMCVCVRVYGFSEIIEEEEVTVCHW